MAAGIRTLCYSVERQIRRKAFGKYNMKLTDLEKAKGLKINSKMSQAKTPGRFAAEAHVAVDRREQRKRDQAAGLVPFAVKLDGELVKRVQQLAVERDGNINEVVAELLNKALGR